MSSTGRRLAIFLPGLYGGGAERTMLNLAQGFANRGVSVDLVLARALGPYVGEIPESVRLVELHTARRLRLFRTLSGLPALVHYLRCERPDAMLSALTYANVIAVWAWRLAGVPARMVVNEQNTFSVWNQQLRDWYGWLMLRLVRRMYPRADGIVAVSGGVADDLARTTGIARERIRVIYNPIVTPELQAKAQLPLEHAWFASDEPPVLLAVGRLAPQKDFPTLVRAFARVRETRLARLLILGEGDERPTLEALIQELGLEESVSLPGFVANPYAFMSRASVFVLSSKWEGLPTVLVEALCCGVPVVATDCPSGPREILAEGQYGRLVAVGDVSALARAIEVALDGQTPHPPRESWLPYRVDAVLDRYADLLFGS